MVGSERSGDICEGVGGIYKAWTHPSGGVGGTWEVGDTHGTVGDTVGAYLAILPVLDVLLPVEEPIRDLVLPRVLHDGDDPLHLPGKGTRDK